MPLLTIADPERILARAEDGPQSLPLVVLPKTGTNRYLLKLKPPKIYGCCEALGYLLAGRLQVTVMPGVPVWCPRAFHCEGGLIGDGRIGCAVQYVDRFCRITWEQAALQAPETVAGSLVLCLLNRDEWGEFADTPYGVVFYDLERLFPPFCPERLPGQTWDDVADELVKTTDTYNDIAASSVEEVIDEADKLNLMESFRLALEKAATISREEFRRLFDLQPHPLAKQIADIAANAAMERFRYTSELLPS